MTTRDPAGNIHEGPMRVVILAPGRTGRSKQAWNSHLYRAQAMPAPAKTRLIRYRCPQDPCAVPAIRLTRSPCPARIRAFTPSHHLQTPEPCSRIPNRDSWPTSRICFRFLDLSSFCDRIVRVRETAKPPQTLRRADRLHAASNPALRMGPASPDHGRATSPCRSTKATHFGRQTDRS